MRLPANDRAFNALLDSLKVGMIAFVGAGTSIPCGYPSWQRLLDLLRDEADTYDPRPPRTSPQADVDDLLWTAEECRRRLSDDRYLAFVKKTFDPKLRGDVKALQYLVKLPLKDFLTTNYDNLIELVETDERIGVAPASLCWSNHDGVREFLARLALSRGPNEQRRVVHLHGKWDQPSSIVLTERDYTKRYVSSDSTNRILFSLFAIQPVLFVGFSLSDPDLTVLLRQVQASLGPGSPHHFAILGIRNWSDEPTIRQRLEGKFGISPVFYPIVIRDKRDSHEGLEILLRRLVEALAAAKTATPSVMGSGTIPSWVDPADPHKRAFGEESEAGGFAMTGTVEDSKDRLGWFSVDLKVTSTDAVSPLTGKVTFYLHPSFRNHIRAVAPTCGEAKIRLLAYGSFTVGATVEQNSKEVRLELDLAEIANAPHDFKTR